MRFITTIIATAVAASFSAAAPAQDGREQLRAETAAAVAAGQIPYGEITRDESRHFVPGKTFAQGRAEAAAAVASGQIAFGEVMRFADASDGSGKSRAQVRGETIEAMRLGLIPYGQVPIRAATPADLESIRLAGVRAARVNGIVASK